MAPTRDEVMADIDVHAELTRAMHTADARFARQAQQPMEPHLSGTTEVRGRERRTAIVTSSSDRLLLAAEPRSEHSRYVQLQRDTGAGPVPVGRSQDPQHLPDSERHLYAMGSRGAPSYPAEARQLSQMAPSPHAQFQRLQDEMLVEGPMAASPQASHLATTANIIGIAEQRRDPYMAFASAQSIQRAATEGSGDTPESVFGRRSGNVNLSGTLPASGTGAVGVFRAVRESLEQGTAPPPRAARVIENMADVQQSLMVQGFDQTQAQHLAEEGMSREFIADAMTARMRSAASRIAARMTGQSTYNLRSLTQAQEDDPMGET
jgi:hypothetical protein